MRRLVILCSIGAVAMISCSDDVPRNDRAYCDSLAAQQELLIAPMNTAADIVDTIARYRGIAVDAPLDVDQQWNQIADVLEQASTADVNDPVAQQEVVDAAYSAEQAAREIATHAATTCNLETLNLILPPPLAG